MLDDGVIDPRDTRRVLAFTLSIARESTVRPLNPITFGVAAGEESTTIACCSGASV